jgi:hypothetical protein
MGPVSVGRVISERQTQVVLSVLQTNAMCCAFVVGIYWVLRALVRRLLKDGRQSEILRIPWNFGDCGFGRFSSHLDFVFARFGWPVMTLTTS